jgi:hypothetical protein
MVRARQCPDPEVRKPLQPTLVRTLVSDTNMTLVPFDATLVMLDNVPAPGQRLPCWDDGRRPSRRHSGWRLP